MRLSATSMLLFILLCSCTSRIPEPVSYLYSQQKKMQASSHWEVLAADLANRINKQLIITDNIDKAVFVKETCGDEAIPCQPHETSSFNEAFRDLLITNLFGYGVPTYSRPDEKTIAIQYKVQIVYHNTDRIRTLQPGILTSLSAAVMVLYNAPIELVVVASGMAADIANTSLVQNGHYEVIITTSMIQRDQYLFRASDIYYINDEDFFHYQENMPQTKTIMLSSGQLSEQAMAFDSSPLNQQQLPTDLADETDTLPPTENTTASTTEPAQQASPLDSSPNEPPQLLTAPAEETATQPPTENITVSTREPAQQTFPLESMPIVQPQPLKL
jgi:hypothetical protein